MHGADFSVDLRDAAVLVLHGELDASTAARLHEPLVDLTNEPDTVIELDLRDLTFVDSSGLGIMVTALKRAREHGGDVVLRSVPPRAMAVLEITGLTNVFTILP